MQQNPLTWWFENQYCKTIITINNYTITINHRGLSTFSLKKIRDFSIEIVNIKKLIIKKPTFWQAGYLYFVLKNENELMKEQEIVLNNNTIVIKRKNEWLDIQNIKNIIDKKMERV